MNLRQGHVKYLGAIGLSGIVAKVFGVRYMTTFFGIVFLSHQVGSFLGVWLGGWIHDATGSYHLMWWAGVVLSAAATIVHPHRRETLARLFAGTAPETS